MKTLLCCFLVSAMGIISQENEVHSVSPWMLTGSGATISIAATLIFSPNTKVPALKPSVPEKISPIPIPLTTPMAPEPIPHNESMVITVDHEKIINNNLEKIKENSHIKTTIYQDAITKNIVKNTIIIYRQWEKTYHQEVPIISMATTVAPSTRSKQTPVATTMANGVRPTTPVAPVVTNENLKENPSIKPLSKKKSKKTQETHWVFKPISVNNPTAQITYGDSDAKQNHRTMVVNQNKDTIDNKSSSKFLKKKTKEKLPITSLTNPILTPQSHISYEDFPEKFRGDEHNTPSPHCVDNIIDIPRNTHENTLMSSTQPWEKKAIMNTIWGAFNYLHQKAMENLFLNFIPVVL